MVEEECGVAGWMSGDMISVAAFWGAVVAVSGGGPVGETERVKNSGGVKLQN